MPRLREVPRAEVTDHLTEVMYGLLFGDRDPVAEPGTSTGTPGDWWTVYALSPAVLRHAVDGFGLYQSPDRVLDPTLRELAQTRTGWLRGSRFVFSQHCKSCRSLGIAEAKVAAIPQWATADAYSPAERAVLAYTDALVGDGGRVSDGTFAALRAHLDDVAILELTYITAMYDMHATISRALRLELDDRDEPVTELVVDGITTMDVGAQISGPAT